MRWRINKVIISLVLLSASSLGFSQAGFKIEHWKTRKGVPVYFVERPEVPIVDICTVFDAGSARDHKAAGLANFTASLIGEGTKTRDSAQIAKDFAGVGAVFASDVNRDMALVTLRVLTDRRYFSPGFATYLDVVSHPNFSKKDFLRVKGQIFDGIKLNLQNPYSVAKDLFYKSIYGDQPYGHPVLGTQQSVDNISLKQIKHFYKDYYVSRNAKIIIVGDVTRAQADSVAERIALGFKRGAKAKKLKLTHQVEKGKKIFQTMPVTQSSIIIGQNSIRRQNPDRFNLMLANHVLGGLPLTSLLFEKVRNKHGLVYGVNSGFRPLEARGPFMIMLQTRSAKTQQAISLVDKVLKQYMQEGPTAAELQIAKLNLLGSFPLKLSSNTGVLGAAINIAFYHLPLDYLQNYAKSIKAVTPERAKKAFDDLISFKRLNTIVVGKSQANGASC